MKLSIIIPVFNEEKTVSEIVKRVKNARIPGFEKEIIIVNDGSTDTTSLKLKKISNVKLINKIKNEGKGAAVRDGVSKSQGDYIIIQDADLEYNPEDIQKLTAEIRNGAKIVYGTRLDRLPNFSKDEKTLLFLLHYLGNRFLSILTSILYGQWITDMETCYKLFPRKSLEKIKLTSRGFEFEPEITSKLLKAGFKILEVPIVTKPRSYKEGKKLNTIRDGTLALWTLLKYKFVD